MLLWRSVSIMLFCCFKLHNVFELLWRMKCISGKHIWKLTLSMVLCTYADWRIAAATHVFFDRSWCGWSRTAMLVCVCVCVCVLQYISDASSLEPPFRLSETNTIRTYNVAKRILARTLSEKTNTHTHFKTNTKVNCTRPVFYFNTNGKTNKEISKQNQS